MASNRFESSRISEGTRLAGAYHVANPPSKPDGQAADEPNVAGQEGLNGHRLRKPVPPLLGASTLTGASVRNAAGESLGKIDEIMLDLARGKIAYAVLSFGGVLGIGNKLFILPWSSLEFNQNTNEILLNVQREVLENGPGFEGNSWPDLADPEYAAEIHRYYGTVPYWENTIADFSSEEFRCCE